MLPKVLIPLLRYSGSIKVRRLPTLATTLAILFTFVKILFHCFNLNTINVFTVIMVMNLILGYFIGERVIFLMNTISKSIVPILRTSLLMIRL